VERVRDRDGAYSILVGNLNGRNHLEDLGVDGKILLTCIFKKWEEKSWTGLLLLGIGTGDRLL
jgi:hypothetical protein